MLLVAGVLGYGWFGARAFIAGPVIEIIAPLNGASTTESLVEIRGIAKNISDITLNDRKIFTDKQGVWSEQVLLHPGYNVIKMNARDRIGRKTEKTLELVLKEKPRHLTLAPN